MSQVGLTMSNDTQAGPPPKRKRSGIAVIVAMLVVLGLLAVGGVVAYRALLSGPADYEGSGSGNVVVTIKQGQSITSMGQTLTTEGVIASPEAFVQAASANPEATSIQAGVYQMRSQMSAASAIDLMTDPAARAGVVVIPEGSRTEETVKRASAATGVAISEYLPYLKDPSELNLPTWANNHVEGFLFPATYDFAPGTPAKDQLVAMVDKFKEVAAEINLEKRAAAAGHSPYDVVIVASLLEGEGKTEDFAKIARVIFNRVDCTLPQCKTEYIQGRLQLDSTINYAKGTDELNLSGEDLKEDGPYNTYINKGLPPTPIDNPGTDALEAALAPAEGNWLYFVSDTNFTEFSETYEQHQAAEARWRASKSN